jgi:tRNA (guanine37-N1)-methyltransferase
MKRFHVLTIFPQMFAALRVSKIFARAEERNMIGLEVVDIRAYSDDKHQSVDDAPYGGGPGMVMRVEPIVAAMEKVAQGISGNARRIYLSPKGRTWTQEEAKRLLAYSDVVLVCGRYEGIDQRVIDGWIDEEISAGPYILSGGELPAMMVIETMARLLPDVLGNAASLAEETVANGLPEYPHYTRPRIFRGLTVPDVLTSGDHAAIAKWRRDMAGKHKR